MKRFSGGGRSCYCSRFCTMYRGNANNMGAASTNIGTRRKRSIEDVAPTISNTTIKTTTVRKAAATAMNDENNNTKNAAAAIAVKSIGGLRDGPRRAILGDVSNGAIMNEGSALVSIAAANAISQNTIEDASAAGVSRNLRAKTIQATMATRAKVLGSINGNAPSAPIALTDKERAGGRQEEPSGKENIAPTAVPLAVTRAAIAQKQQDWDDLDAEDLGDPLMVSEYVEEIIEYMKSIEKELNWHMRAILVDWLVENQWKLKLLPETLFLSINLIDRFLSKRAVTMMKLQLVGLTATMISSKVEEVLSPSVANFIYISDNAYGDQELLKAERYMLHALNYVLSFPSPLTFLRRCSKAEAYDVRTRTLGKYFMETSLLDESFVGCPPSMLAAMSIYLARLMLNCGPWTPNLRHYSGYEEPSVKQHANRLLEYFKCPLTHKSIYKKYSSKKLMKASVFVEAWIRRTYPDCPAALAPSTAD